MDNAKIFQQLPLITAEIKAVGKDHTNTFQHYKFRSIDDVFNVANMLLGKHKVTIIPSYKVLSEVIGKTAKGGEQKNVVLEATYTFYADDGSSVSCITIGEASDTSDKAYNKAMSTAFKYALFQVFCIPTEEEKDTELKSPPAIKKELSKELLLQVNTVITKSKVDREALKKYYKVGSIKEITEAQAEEIVKRCNDKIKEDGKNGI